ncbi:MAG: asparagine synthase (glutamine-hydrolyzing) [Kiritimatiellae bacterium]|nr:asparagine synthase (glutamine-hydrolyzing) [Kiritimatiellia bacterium]
MCGICGFNWNDARLVKAMADEMVHRGPDQHGVYCADGVSLGHRRLSIIDLSEQGRQPMSNEDGTVQLVFNGEIYNFQELRPALEAKGHQFVGRSDSEVILHGYEEYGVEVVHKLRGMFAFAVWDAPRKRLFLARDRIGIKPLYYYHQDRRFVFGSEIKAILKDPAVPRELNHQALYEYLGFEFVPAPETMFRHIFKLPAGHYAVWENDRLQISEYWDLAMGDGTPPLPYDAAIEQERELLEYAVKSHLVSDVPLGVFLSGGLDSSALVAAMRKHISGPLRTFTIGYPDKTFSELDYARIVADRFETEHHVLMIDYLNQAYVEKALWHLDEPMTDLSTVPLMLVCEKAKEFVTVCLSGEGGDESFAGYDRFKASRINRFYGLVPGPVRRQVISRLVGRLPDQPQKKGAVNMLKRFIEGSNLPAAGAHLRWQYFGTADQDERLFNAAFKTRAAMDPFRHVTACAARSGAADTVNREIYLDMRFMMTESVLMKVDKMSMASSLEIRVPLLDHVFVEFMASLPGNWKLKGLQTKAVFRSALKGILPDAIVHRGKQGYSLPVKQLLRTQLKEYMIELLNDSPIIRENTNVDYVSRLIREHLDMTRNNNHVLWALMNVAIWGRKFL